jgi:hypothetical protein
MIGSAALLGHGGARRSARFAMGRVPPISAVESRSCGVTSPAWRTRQDFKLPKKSSKELMR